MNKPLCRERLIGFVNSRIVVRPHVELLPFLHQQHVSIGLRQPDGNIEWFSEVEQLGGALAADAGFRALELGTWLNSPDGAFIAEAVGQVLPPSYRPEYRFVVEALKFAASRQRSDGLQRAVGAGALTALGVVVVWLFGSGR